MSWAGSEAWDLYLGAESSGLACGGRNPIWLAHADVLAGVEAGFAHLTQARSRWQRLRGPTLRVWLSGALARPFMLECPAGLKNLKERRAWAESQATNATGLAGPCTVWFEEARGGGATLAVAIPTVLRDALVATAKAQRVRLRGIRPWWNVALDVQAQSEPQPELFAAADTESLVLLHTNAGAWVSAGSFVPRSSVQSMELLITRRQFAHDVSAEKTRRMQLQRGEALNQTWPAPLTVLQWGES